MAISTSISSSSPPSWLSETPVISASAASDDSSDDSCSICLEPFSSDDPAAITSCKHEYHLQCILEWSQRSKECPICWQLLVLKDPSCQELLAAVGAERLSRSRNMSSSMSTNYHSSYDHLHAEHEDFCSDDSDFDEHIMQHLVAAATRGRYLLRRRRQISSEAGPSHVVFDFSATMTDSSMDQSSPESGSHSPASITPSAINLQPPPTVFHPTLDLESSNSTVNGDDPFKLRVTYSKQPPESPRRMNTSEVFSFPESIKSKFSAASARYKESISKGTRGIKEKLFAHNSSVKELSQGVQREMNAGIAGVARMIERLELTSKRFGTSVPSSDGGASGIPLKEKNVQENVTRPFVDRVGDLRLDASRCL